MATVYNNWMPKNCASVMPGPGPAPTVGASNTSTQKYEGTKSESIGSRNGSATQKKKGSATIRVLVAMMPHVQMTVEESSMIFYDLFRKKCGATDRRTGREWTKLTRYLYIASAWVLVLLTPLSPVTQLVGSSIISYELRITLHCISAAMATLLTLLCVANCNVVLFKMLVRRFEAVFFAVQALIFSFGVWGIFCFSIPGFFMSWATVLAVFWILLYDAYPLYIRRRFRWAFLCGLCLYTLSILGISRGMFVGMCYNRFDIFRGVIDGQEYTVWSVSLHKTAVNAGFTTLLLAFRTGRAMISSPARCVIINSAMRVVECHSDQELKQVLDQASDDIRAIQSARTRSLSIFVKISRSLARGAVGPQVNYGEPEQGGGLLMLRQQMLARAGEVEKVLSIQPPLPTRSTMGPLASPPPSAVLSLIMGEDEHVGSQLKETGNEGETKVMPFISPVECCPINKPSSSPRPELLAPSAPTPMSSVGQQQEPAGNLAQALRRQHYVLTALTPIIRFTEEESSTTLMMKLLGRRLTARWFRHKFFFNVIGAISIIGVGLSGTMGLHFEFFDTPFGLAMSLLSFSYMVLIHAAATNFRILKLLSRSFHALFLFGEVLLFLIPLWVIQCCTYEAALQVFCYVLGTSLWILFDAVTLVSRRFMRVSYAIGAIMALSGLFSLQFHELKSYCFARFSTVGWGLTVYETHAMPSHTLIPMELDPTFYSSSKNITSTTGADESTSASSLINAGGGAITPFNELYSFSVLEFAITRCVTILVLMGRIMFCAIKYPDECVILQSVVRLVEVVENDTDRDKAEVRL